MVLKRGLDGYTRGVASHLSPSLKAFATQYIITHKEITPYRQRVPGDGGS